MLASRKTPIARFSLIAMALAAFLSQHAVADDSNPDQLKATTSYLVSENGPEALRVTAFWDMGGKADPTVYFIQVCDKTTHVSCHDLEPGRAFVLDSELDGVISRTSKSQLFALTKIVAHLFGKTASAEVTLGALEAVKTIGDRRDNAGGARIIDLPAIEKARATLANERWVAANDSGDVKVVSLPDLENVLKPVLAKSSLGQFGAY